MKHRASHFTLREFFAVLHYKLHFTVLFLSIFVQWIIGPFGTYDELDLFTRLGYFTAVVLGGYVVGVSCVGICVSVRPLCYWPWPVTLVISASVGSLILAQLFTWLDLNIRGPNSVPFWSLAFQIFFAFVAIAGIIRSAIPIYDKSLSAPWMKRREEVAHTETPVTPKGEAEPEEPAPFLARIPPELGTCVISLTAQDHYVEVHLKGGTTLVLQRFADAVREIEPIPGARIHRSHWVSQDAAREIVRRDGKIWMKLADKRELPVSRTYREAAEQLLTPRN